MRYSARADPGAGRPPSLVVSRDGETRGFHSLADTRPDALAMVARSVSYRRGDGAPRPPADGARQVLAALPAAVESGARGVVVDVATVETPNE